MEKADWLRIAEKVIETVPELITAIVAYLTYKELKKKSDSKDSDQEK
ncbi:hypothetical protein [Atopobacter sp. AH10]|nr:hypothetical protein [Atopobacter sp. AH10]